jgi:hypothetical protein
MSLTMSTVIGDGRASSPLAFPRGAAVTAANELIAASGLSRTLNVTGAAVLIKAGAGRLCRVFVNTLSAAPSTFNDAATVGGAAAANLLFTIPANAPVGSIYELDAPFTAGLVATPGASGVLAIVWT